MKVFFAVLLALNISYIYAQDDICLASINPYVQEGAYNINIYARNMTAPEGAEHLHRERVATRIFTEQSIGVTPDIPLYKTCMPVGVSAFYTGIFGTFAYRLKGGGTKTSFWQDFSLMGGSKKALLLPVIYYAKSALDELKLCLVEWTYGLFYNQN